MGGDRRRHLMTGVLAITSGGLSSTVFSGTLTVGSGFIGSKFYSSTAYGFGTAASTYGGFGALAPASWRGFPIVAIYMADSAGVTTFEVTGDATAFHPVLTAGGVNQALGAGSFGGGFTTYQSAGTVADPFFGQTNVAIGIT
jgi:hypothetical protein